jgi:hypothetical protein
MEDIDDDDKNLGTYPLNVAPLNRSHILELSDGSDDKDCPPLIPRDDEDSVGQDDADKSDAEEPEESAEAELG